ncbi:MAG TPA: protein kinase, partial [Chthoniobacterales bacterium]|nr:protein kinase [Chthoniobacterales bacterium]
MAERADEQYRKQVAIKLIKRGMDTESVLRHFRNERQILANFDHPNIARLFDAGTTETGLPYFVMEYVEGLTIDQYCDQQALGVNDRLKLFREVCGAVSYAHRHLVIHRDIKRSNILVTAEGVPKLLDFGIAKILQGGNGIEQFATVTGLQLMTPEYASPEQLRGEPVTTATDVYSLGIVLYELLTHRSPYGSSPHTPHELARAITDAEPKKPSTVIPTDTSNPQSAIRTPKLLRGDLDNIVLMALRKEPARRYQSVEQFSEDIRRHLEALPVRARKDTLAYRGAKFIRRNRTATVAAALIFLVLVAGVIATSRQAHLAKVQKTRAEKRFNDVRKLANSVLFDYHDAIKDLPGATAVRDRLVRDGLNYLDSLAEESAGDSGLQRELASAYERVGDVRGEPYGASLGDAAGALNSYEKATRIREAVVTANPRDTEARRDLAASYSRIGIQLQETSEARRGMDYLRKAFAIYAGLAAEHPADLKIREELASSYNSIGTALEAWGDIKTALENHRNALRLREELCAADPANENYRRSLAVTHVNLGRALLLSGDANAALASNGRANALMAALFQANPANAGYRRVLAITYQNDGDYRHLLGDLRGALESFRKKLVLDEQALADDPVNAQAREDFGYTCQRLGFFLGSSGEYAQALSYLEKATGIFEKIVTDAPKSFYQLYQLIIVRGMTAEMRGRLHQPGEALAECARANSLMTRAADDPS